MDCLIVTKWEDIHQDYFLAYIIRTSKQMYKIWGTAKVHTGLWRGNLGVETTRRRCRLEENINTSSITEPRGVGFD